MLAKACVFRVDESPDIGKGHFTRCSTIAAQLIALDVPCLFICNQISDSSKQKLDKLKIDYCEFEIGNSTEISDAYKSLELIQEYIFAENTILIVDSYRLGFVWESFLFDKVARICVIDELGERMHKCHMVVDQTYGKTSIQNKKLLPVTEINCIGGQYALVGKAFLEQREYCLENRAKNKYGAEKILITMGGSDPVNATSLVLQALKLYDRGKKLKVTIVVGGLCKHLKSIRKEAKSLDVESVDIIVNTNNMAQLMATNDICISAAGSTVWELATLGVPTLAIQTVDNQEAIYENLSAVWAVYPLGKYESLTPKAVYESMLDILNGKVSLKDLSRKIARVTDGKGVERVVDALLSGFP